MVNSSLYYNVHYFSKMTFTCPDYTHYNTHSTLHAAYFAENFDTWLQEYYQFHVVLYYIHKLLVTIYSSCKQWIFHQYSCCRFFYKKKDMTWHSCNHKNTHYTHQSVCHTKLRYQYKNMFYDKSLAHSISLIGMTHIISSSSWNILFSYIVIILVMTFLSHMWGTYMTCADIFYER
jgi:hypothetical protein